MVDASMFKMPDSDTGSSNTTTMTTALRFNKVTRRSTRSTAQAKHSSVIRPEARPSSAVLSPRLFPAILFGVPELQGLQGPVWALLKLLAELLIFRLQASRPYPVLVGTERKET